MFYPEDERKGFDGVGGDGNPMIFDATMQELLLPGSDSETVKCNIRDADGKESTIDHVVKDPYRLNCCFPGEIIQVVWDPQSGSLMPNGSYGLLRKATAKADIASGEIGVCDLLTDNKSGELVPVGEVDVTPNDGGIKKNETLWIKFCRDLGTKDDNANNTKAGTLGKWVPIKGSGSASNTIRGYCLSDVSTADATFTVMVTESFPGSVEGEVVVVNPLDAVGSSKHGYELKQNDYITALTWLDETYLCIDGPCSTENDKANNPPTAISLSNSSVDEESPGAVVGTLTVTDADLPNDSHSLSIIGTDNDLEIDGTTLKVKDASELDSANSPIVVSIEAVDDGGLRYEEDFSITINSITSLGRFALDNINPNFALFPAAPSKDHADYGAGVESIPAGVLWRINNYTSAPADTIAFEVRNTGSDTLTVSSIEISNPLFSSIDKSSMSIAAGGTDTVTVTLFGALVPDVDAYYRGVIKFVHDGDSFGQPSPFYATIYSKCGSSTAIPP